MSEPSTTITLSTSRNNCFAWCACLIALALTALTPWQTATADDDPLRKVAVGDPSLERSTGPGRGHPIFHVVDRGDQVEIMMQRTDW